MTVKRATAKRVKKSRSAVEVRENSVSYPTYSPMPPDKHPMFLERRVYQGSSGKVYPLPVYDRIADKKKPRKWKAVHIENEYLRLTMLPELGGRIHIGQDKTNNYDFFYRQNVIKPALVGLAGPWISGGVEFNWPQHHRPATFMPVDYHIEKHDDGSKTVWFSDHDPLARMKGMHGVCIHPGKAVIELKVRAYNRTPFVQTFLWWANVGVKVHEGYQSFFPPDVSHVADHAKRATASYPLCEGSYYGVDYGSRKNSHKRYQANDLTWYANIPVPTSYMCVGSKEDFFGGYDHNAKAGLVHVANHHISPGKKQWTWGNHEFGYAWDRNLTDEDGPYIELMAGVYTDNQPDFSFLQPGETKTWSQYWYPIRDIGPAQKANVDAAISLQSRSLGVAVTQALQDVTVELLVKGKTKQSWKVDISPQKPFVKNIKVAVEPHHIRVRVVSAEGRELISHQAAKPKKAEVPAPALEPVAPKDMKSADDLYLTGLHLDQYRHATRKPEDYWLEALRRDPNDSRCNNGLGLRCLRRGQFVEAKKYFEAAISRLTLRNPNPYDGEAYYNLGLTLRYLNQDDEAYDAFYKATWNQAWQSAAYQALAELDCRKQDWTSAQDHLERSLKMNVENLRARNLLVMVLRKLDQPELAELVLDETLSIDSLDWWARSLSGQEIQCDTQTRIDLAIDFARAGFHSEAFAILAEAKAETLSGTEPLVLYYLGWLSEDRELFEKAASAPSDYCFPSRLEEIEILQTAIERNPKDAKAPYYLGNLYYDKDRFEDAIEMWELSTKRDSKFSVVWRNLGIAHFNVRQDTKRALAAFEKAFQLAPKEPRILYERDQLWKRIGESPSKRLQELENNISLVKMRDDLSVELCTLYNQTGSPEKAQKLLQSRNFQPWEGGEGLALGQHVRTHLMLSRNSSPKKAVQFMQRALASPHNLGESKHLLANQSDIHFLLGKALAESGKRAEARKHWQMAAEYKGDFQQMSVQTFSELSYYTGKAMEALGQKKSARKLFTDMLKYSKNLEKQKAKVDYFATSLPTMLLFNDDLQVRQVTNARFMQALALHGLGQKKKSMKLIKDVLKRDPSHQAAADFRG